MYWMVTHDRLWGHGGNFWSDSHVKTQWQWRVWGTVRIMGQGEGGRSEKRNMSKVSTRERKMRGSVQQAFPGVFWGCVSGLSSLLYFFWRMEDACNSSACTSKETYCHLLKGLKWHQGINLYFKMKQQQNTKQWSGKNVNGIVVFLHSREFTHRWFGYSWPSLSVGSTNCVLQIFREIILSTQSMHRPCPCHYFLNHMA